MTTDNAARHGAADIEELSRQGLIRKYALAGKIRCVSFTLLLFFLLGMKYFGGCAYLNSALLLLIIVEIIVNQPHDFIIRRVNIRRFQYYQMLVDIITISWLAYYMGGLEAPVVSIAYYGVILWAGVVSGIPAVFFAVITSALFFISIVVGGYTGILPPVSYAHYTIPFSHMLSLLFGNLAFLFAFGYFSAHSAMVIKALENKRQEETLKQVHKLIATGYLVSNTAHDILNCLANIRGYTTILRGNAVDAAAARQMLEAIERLQTKSAESLIRLARFSRKPKPEFLAADINEIIEEALLLTWPRIRYANAAIKKTFASELPPVTADKDQLQEVFVVLILNSLDAISKKGEIAITTAYHKEHNKVGVIFSDNGAGIAQEDVRRLGEPFFTTKGKEKGFGVGLAVAYEIISRHNAEIEVQSEVGRGTTFVVRFPAA